MHPSLSLMVSEAWVLILIPKALTFGESCPWNLFKWRVFHCCLSIFGFGENVKHSVDGLASGSHHFRSVWEMLQHQWTQYLPLQFSSSCSVTSSSAVNTLNAFTKFEPLSVVVNTTLFWMLKFMWTLSSFSARLSYVCLPLILKQAKAPEEMVSVSESIQWTVTPR